MTKHRRKGSERIVMQGSARAPEAPGFSSGLFALLVILLGSNSLRAGNCTSADDCADGRLCTIDVCVFGRCFNDHSDGPCDDNRDCNGQEICDSVSDSCLPGIPIVCNPGQFCSTVLDRCVECEVDNHCNDGVFCNGFETCSGGQCFAGVAVDCSFQDNECRTGFCDEANDTCDVIAVCDDGSQCTDDVCVVGDGCLNTPNFTIGVECCDPATGAAEIINDGDSCTVDVCNALTGVVSHVPGRCDDGNACTIDDRCVGAGGCGGQDVNLRSCSSDDDCPAGVCSAITGTCECSPCTSNSNCNDGVPCTVDTCDTELGFCRFQPDDGQCDTGLFCSADVCDRDLGCVVALSCTPVPGNPCPDPASCDESANHCGCNAPTVVSEGARYLGITPAPQGTVLLALLVTGDCEDSSVSCVSRYVDFDSPVNPADPSAGRLVDNPVYRTKSQWGSVHVRADDIDPGATYRVFAQCNRSGVLTLSAGNTARTWKWGDSNNDGLVDFEDISRTVDAFKGQFVGGLTLENSDLMGVDNCVAPDRDVSFADISANVDAFRGLFFSCGMSCP